MGNLGDRYITLRQYANHRGISLESLKRRIEAGRISQDILKHDGRRRYLIDEHAADDILDGFV